MELVTGSLKMRSQTCDDLVISPHIRLQAEDRGGWRTLMAAGGGDAAKRVVSEGLAIGHSSRFRTGSDKERQVRDGLLRKAEESCTSRHCHSRRKC